MRPCLDHLTCVLRDYDAERTSVAAQPGVAAERHTVGRMHLNHHSPNVCGMIISENTTVSVEHCCCSSYSHADRSASGGYRDRWHQSYYTVRPGYRAFVWLLHAGLGSATDCQMAERSLFAGWRHVDCPGG